MQAFSDTLPVLSEPVAADEQFAGVLNGETLVISSNRGTRCTGRIRLVGLGYGSGHLRCSDGRTGNLSVSIQGQFGSAYGRLGSDPIHLIIG